MAAAIAGPPGCGGKAEADDTSDDTGPVRHQDAGNPDVGQPDTGAPEAAMEAAVDTGVDTGPPKGLVTVPLSGCVPSYTASITIGGTQTFQLVLDTGSTTMGVASSSCTDCSSAGKVSPLYTPGSTAVDEHQTAKTEYESMNTWSGEVYQDSVTAGTPAATAPVKLVAIDTQSEFFNPVSCGGKLAPYEGIIGFAPAGSAVGGTNGYLDDLVATGFMPNEFAVQLCDIGGTLWLGGYDMTHVTAPVEYVPMSSGFFSTYDYVVNLSQITVAGTTVPVSSGMYSDSLIDTGTSVFILNTDAFDSVTTAITGDSTFQSVVSSSATWFDNNDNCVALSQTKAELDAILPTLTLVYGTSPTVSIVAVATESYLFSYGNYWCPALYSYASSYDFPFAAILGSPVLKSSVTVIDRANSQIGFAPHTPCP